MNTIVWVFAIATAAFLWRHARAPVLFGDTCQFLRVAESIRLQRRFPGVLEYNLMDAIEKVRFDYPPLLVLLLALWPTAQVERWLRAVLVVNDLLALFSTTAAAWALTRSLEAAAVAAAVYFATPNLCSQTAMLTARFLSLALFPLSISLALLAATGQGPMWLLLPAAVLAALLLLANALAIQAWLVVLLGLVATSNARAVWVGYGVASLVLCYALAGRIAWRVHRGLVEKLVTLKRYGMDDIRIRTFDLLQHVRRGSREPRSETGLALRLLMRAVLFVEYPAMWTLVAAGALGWRPHPWTDVHSWLAALLVAHLTIDTVAALRFVGPAHRYLSYALVPMSLLIAGVPPSEPTVLHSVFLASLLGGLALGHRRLRALTAGAEAAVAELRELGARLKATALRRLLVLPMQLSDPVGYLTGRAMLHGWASRAWGVGPRYGIYPVLKRPLEEIVAIFGLDGLILRKDYVRLEELALKRARLEFETPAFTVYAVGTAVSPSDSGWNASR
jgi:hypothetical protein